MGPSPGPLIIPGLGTKPQSSRQRFPYTASTVCGTAARSLRSLYRIATQCVAVRTIAIPEVLRLKRPATAQAGQQGVAEQNERKKEEVRPDNGEIAGQV